MNKAGHISAAIEKLERLKAESTPGPWDTDGREIDQHWSLMVEPYTKPLLPVVSAEVSCISQCYGGSAQGLANTADGELIVTLHRTIDVQLASLRGGLVLANRGHDVTLGWAVDIADAILGSDS